MSALTVLTALRVEAAAIRAGLPAGTATVRAGGMGRRARDRTAEAGCPGPLAVAGVAGALAPGLAAGDLVVASEVRGPTGTLACPSAELLAGALRRVGLTAHVGPVQTAQRVVTGAARASLAAGGALAVDMESAWLARAAGGQPLCVVRAVVDGPGHPLLAPGTPARGWRALRSLRAAAPVLAQWAASVGPRELTLAAPSSFCAGVERAIAAVEAALGRHGAPVYVRRQIVHNAHVVADLQRRGAIFVDELAEVPPGAVTVFSAHGVAPVVWDQAAERGLTVVDATCPLVAKVHTEVRRFAGRQDLLVYIGHPGHDETEGTLGEAPDRLHLVASAEAVAALPDAAGRPVRYVTQTTLALDEAADIVSALRRRYGEVEGPPGEDICYATSNRQAAVSAVAAESDLVLVIGSGNSSNSRRLVEVATRAGTPAHLVEDTAGVDLRWLPGVRRIGLSAGASAPPPLVDELARALSGLSPAGSPTQIRTRRVAAEDIVFVPPREVHPA